jgi:N-acetylmuramoyl-L-alanine amidase
MNEDKQKKVTVDPGHGDQPNKWNDGGAQSKDKKTTEKNIVLTVSNAIVDELQTNNINVTATRTGDVSHEDSQPKLEWRTKIANDEESDVFVSVHADSQPKNPKASGMTVHYKSKEGKKIAQKILNAQKTMPKRKIEQNNHLRVLNKTKMPAVLVEIGFLSNQSDLTKMRSESNLKSIGKEIATGIINYFNSKK